MADEGLKVVDAFDLDPALRDLLRPGVAVRTADGRAHHLPRYFYEVPSHEAARDIFLTPHFALNEFLMADLKEAPGLRSYPRYVPCAIRTLAFYLERFREVVGAPLHLAVNGGYRSPAHRLSSGASAHMWGTAADLFRVGSTTLTTEEAIVRYGRLAQDFTEDWWVMPYGHGIGKADDHLHLELGYLVVVPREMSEDRLEAPQATPRFAIEERRRGDRRRFAREALGPQDGDGAGRNPPEDRTDLL